jgi:hypothetical protein
MFFAQCGVARVNILLALPNLPDEIGLAICNTTNERAPILSPLRLAFSHYEADEPTLAVLNHQFLYSFFTIPSDWYDES